MLYSLIGFGGVIRQLIFALNCLKIQIVRPKGNKLENWYHRIQGYNLNNDRWSLLDIFYEEKSVKKMEFELSRCEKVILSSSYRIYSAYT